MKRSFFQAAVVSILLYGCTTWTLTKRPGEETWRQLHKNVESNIELSPGEHTPHEMPTVAATNASIYSKTTIQVRRDTFTPDTAGEARTSFESDVLLWTPTYGQAKADDQPNLHTAAMWGHQDVTQKTCRRLMNFDREKWREMSRISVLLLLTDDIEVCVSMCAFMCVL